MNSLELYFKIEKLDSNDNIVEELTPVLVDGDIRLDYDDTHRRTCTFSLLQELPNNWMSARWKLYYGRKIDGVIEYTPQGVYIPINPSEEDVLSNKLSKYQGVDKAQLLVDEFSDIPIVYPAGTTLKQIAQDIFARINETKLNLDDVPYSLATDFIFEEGVSLEHILSTLVRSFNADWYYDANGYAVLEELPAPSARAIVRDFTEDSDSIFVTSNRSVDTDKYWNKVIVVGGRVDTGIFRQTYENEFEVTKAGRKVTKFFKEDAATSQDQVNDLATKFLEAGIKLPVNITIQNLPIPTLEPKQIITKNGIKFEVISLNVPLDTGLQTIQAGEII